MQSTKNTEWIQMDWKLRIIDKRQEWRSGQSLTFFSLVDLHILLYCINALYIRLFMWCICALYFIYWTLYFVFFTLLHCVFVQCALHISAFSAVSLRIKIDLLPRPSSSSQAAHHNLRAKTSFIKIQIRRISSKYMFRIYEQENSKYWNWRKS